MDNHEITKRNVPRRYKKLYKHAMTGRSMSAAIHIFCLECVAYNWAEVKRCSDPGCSLYPYRHRPVDYRLDRKDKPASKPVESAKLLF